MHAMGEAIRRRESGTTALSCNFGYTRRRMRRRRKTIRFLTGDGRLFMRRCFKPFSATCTCVYNNITLRRPYGVHIKLFRTPRY